MPTLGEDYVTVQKELGFYLGWGRTISAWSAKKLESVTAWIKSGLARMMFSALVPGTQKVYEWSFQRKVHSFSTVADQTEYTLPPDFGGVYGPILWSSSTAYYNPIHFVNEAMVREKLALTPTCTGIPLLAATFYQATSGAAEQRQGLVIWPIPDGAYSLRLQFERLQEMLTTNFPWPPGGAPHGRTLLYACLAESCARTKDNTYEQDYQQALVASMNYDASKKGAIGYCGDPSTSRRYDEERFTDLTVLVNGVQYGLGFALALSSLLWQVSQTGIT